MRLRKTFFKRRPKSTFKLLKKTLEQHSQELISELEDKHKDTLKWFSKKGINLDEVVKTGSRGALTGLAAGFVLLSSGVTAKVEERQVTTSNLSVNHIVGEIKARQAQEQNLLKMLQETLPRNKNQLTDAEADKVAQSVSQVSGINVKAGLAGNRLNTNYGKIGLEQHLPRYPGEKMEDHFLSGSGVSRYLKSGMTRNRGAFGYFAKDKHSLTPDAIEKEKYYVVVQTFAFDGWGKNRNMREWYKHRKMIVINTKNGRAVVGVIADSGPARWTGKSFGGSPELMDQLGMYQGNRKSKVLMFFVDDAGGSIKLGPL